MVVFLFFLFFKLFVSFSSDLWTLWVSLAFSLRKMFSFWCLMYDLTGFLLEFKTFCFLPDIFVFFPIGENDWIRLISREIICSPLTEIWGAICTDFAWGKVLIFKIHCMLCVVLIIKLRYYFIFIFYLCVCGHRWKWLNLENYCIGMIWIILEISSSMIFLSRCSLFYAIIIIAKHHALTNFLFFLVKLWFWSLKKSNFWKYCSVYPNKFIYSPQENNRIHKSCKFKIFILIRIFWFHGISNDILLTSNPQYPNHRNLLWYILLFCS